MNKNKTLVVNCLGGPGTGKSTMAASIFSALKWNCINCELVSEFAKDLVWEKRHKTFENQIYIFGKQHHKIYRLVGQVDIIVTDSPILLTPIYDLEKRECLKQLVLNEYHKVSNLNIFLNRKKIYQPIGRNQNEDDAKLKDVEIKNFLKENNIPFFEITCETPSIPVIMALIKEIYENK